MGVGSDIYSYTLKIHTFLQSCKKISFNKSTADLRIYEITSELGNEKTKFQNSRLIFNIF